MLSRLLRDDRANIAAMGAAIIAIMLGMGAFAVELGNVYLVKTENQRIADLTAVAASIVYNSESNTTALNNAVANISQLNGAPSGAASASVVTSPSGDKNNAILVTVTTSVPLRLARAVGMGSSANVSASAWSEISTSSTSCMIGLYASGNSILVDNGAKVTGTSCAIGAVDNLSLALGSSITASAVYTGGTISNSSGITTTPTAGAIHQNFSGITDPIASNTGVSGAFTNIANVVAKIANPTTPTSSSALNFQWSPLSSCGTCPKACTADPTCPLYVSGGNYAGALPAGSYTYLAVGGGITVVLTSSSPSNVYNFSGVGGTYGINNTGSKLVLGAGTYNINKGVSSGGGTVTTLGAGTYNIGGGISMAGTVSWGAGGTNTIKVNGAVSLGNGGGAFTFGDGQYYFNGALLLSSGPTYFGNSLIEVNGTVTVSSGASLCGTPSPCGSGSSTQSVFNNNTVTFSGGATVNLNAPATGATYGVPGVVVSSNYTSAVGTYAMDFAGGASTTLSGVMYFPNASTEFTGGANTSGANCFEIVANVIYMSGGSATTSTCPQFNAGIGAAKIKLVE